MIETLEAKILQRVKDFAVSDNKYRSERLEAIALNISRRFDKIRLNPRIPLKNRKIIYALFDKFYLAAYSIFCQQRDQPPDSRITRFSQLQGQYAGYYENSDEGERFILLNQNLKKFIEKYISLQEADKFCPRQNYEIFPFNKLEYLFDCIASGDIALENRCFRKISQVLKSCLLCKTFYAVFTTPKILLILCVTFLAFALKMPFVKLLFKMFALFGLL
jgi:hypothetical protein